MASNRLWQVLPLAFCVTPLAAQGPLVAPLGYASVEGEANDRYLIGRKNLGRIMDVYGKDTLPQAIRNATPIQSIALRADGTSLSKTYASKKVYIDLYISTTRIGPQSVSKEFEAFHGTDFCQVQGQTCSFPFLAAASSAPRDFIGNVIPFNHPWYYDMSPRRGEGDAEGLVLDFRIVNKWSSPIDYNLDASGFCRSSDTHFGQAATCFSSAGKTLGIRTAPYSYGGGRLTTYVSNVIPGYTALLGVRIGPRSGMPPLQLPPASGCYLNIVPQFIQTQLGSSQGTANFVFPIPRDPRAVNLEVHLQAAVFDVNTVASYYTSQGLSTRVCGPHHVAQLSERSSHMATTASANIYGLAHIVRFN